MKEIPETRPEKDLPGSSGACRPAERYGAEHLPLTARIDEVLRTKGSCRVKIDGRCASGKSTLGQVLYELYRNVPGGVQLFHMDDYFVPMAQKTPARLSEPGGNVDWERFLREVDAVPLSEPVCWRRFDCMTQTLDAAVTEPPAALRIIEGSYSMHPRLPDPDVSVFLTLDPARQRERILRRNGPEMLERFVSEWIPLEEAYFTGARVPERCQLTFDHTDSVLFEVM